MVEDPLSAQPVGRSVLFGDALLLTTGIFVVSTAVALALQFLVRQLGLPGVLQDLVGSFGVLVVPALGAAATWWLHGRRFGWKTIAGFVAGLVASGLVVFAFSQVAMRLQGGPDPAKGPPWAGIAILVVLALIYLAFIALAIVDGARDMRSAAPLHRRLDTMRFVSAGLCVSLMAVVAVVFILNPADEGSEAGIFAILFALVTGFMVLGADVVTSSPGRESEQTASSGTT